MGVHTVVLYFCVMVVTARRFLVFNMEKGTCFRYVWVLGLKLGGTRRFDYIEKLYINKVTYSHGGSAINYHAKVASIHYRCFLKFDDGEKIPLDSDVDLDRLVNRLKQYNLMLKTTIYDTTTHEAIIIE